MTMLKLNMICSNEDIKQEIVLYRLEHPESRRSSECIALDAMRSRRYSNSWAGRFEHIPIEFAEPFIEPEFEMIECNLLLGKLNKYNRRLLVLYYIYGYTHKEIANILGKERSSITKAINKALDGIRNATEI